MSCVLLLPTHTTVNKVFKSLNNYFTEKLNWFFCVSVWTDEAAAMTGQLFGLTFRTKEVEPGCKFTYCVIPSEMLASRKIYLDVYKRINELIYLK